MIYKPNCLITNHQPARSKSKLTFPDIKLIGLSKILIDVIS